MAECEYSGCNNQVIADGLCSLHLPPEKREAAKFSEELFEKDFVAMLYSQFNSEAVLNSISETELSGLGGFNADAENFHRFLKGDLDDSLSRKYEAQAAHCDEIKLSGAVFSDLSEELSSHIGLFLNTGLKLARKLFFEHCFFSYNIYQVRGVKSSYLKCIFYSPFISISDSYPRFNECLFKESIDLDLMMPSKRRGVYLNGFSYDCSFDGDVFIGSEDPPEEELVISSLLPYKSLSGSLSIKGLTIDLLEIEDVFSVFKTEGRKHIFIKNCKIEGGFFARSKGRDFYLCKDNPPCLYLEDSVFEDVFDLSFFNSNELSFINSSFKKDAVFSGVKARSLNFFNVDFEDFFPLKKLDS